VFLGGPPFKMSGGGREYLGVRNIDRKKEKKKKRERTEGVRV